MPTLDGALHLLQAHGLWLLFPLATVEGPIVTVLAAYLARLGHLNLALIYVIVVAADLFGDGIVYWIGRIGHGSMPAALAQPPRPRPAAAGGARGAFPRQRRPHADHRQADPRRRPRRPASRREAPGCRSAGSCSTTRSARCRRASSSSSSAIPSAPPTPRSTPGFSGRRCSSAR